MKLRSPTLASQNATVTPTSDLDGMRTTSLNGIRRQLFMSILVQLHTQATFMTVQVRLPMNKLDKYEANDANLLARLSLKAMWIATMQVSLETVQASVATAQLQQLREHAPTEGHVHFSVLSVIRRRGLLIQRDTDAWTTFSLTRSD